MIVEQYGLLRTGTNVTSYLFQSNFDILISNSFWKHGLLFYCPKAPIVLSSKGPFAWLESMHRCFGNRRSMKAFLGSPLDIPSNSLGAKIGLCAENPIKMWNWWYGHWVRCRTDLGIYLVRCEDIILHQEEIMTRIANEIGAKRKSANWISLEREALPSSQPVGTIRKGETYEKGEWLLSGGYMEAFSNEDIENVKNQLDVRIAKKIGYNSDGSIDEISFIEL